MPRRNPGTPVIRSTTLRPAALLPAALPPAVSLAIAGAWLVAIVAQATGWAALLHHHSLIEGGAPLWLAVVLFVPGWLVMIAAMMLPASRSTIGVVTGGLTRRRRPSIAMAAFLGAFLLAWMGFGLVAFGGDVALHHAVDATPWLAARPWLIEASVLVVAGGYQLTSGKRRSLAACRHPNDLLPDVPLTEAGAFQIGLRHGLECLGSSWALMLLMFAEGFANLWWMAGLTFLMTYEANGRRGLEAARIAGAVLLLAGVAVVSGALG
jgi:predicted metal-binding membrane protein